MIYKKPRPKAKCDQCPFKTFNKVFGSCNRTPKPAILVVGEAPGEEEDYQGQAFVGPSGRLLKLAMGEVGIDASKTGFTNVLLCRPPGNRINTLDAQKAIECCLPGLIAEVAAWNPKVVLAIGNTARDALYPGAHRGYLYQRDDGPPLVHTFHPSYILQGGSADEPVWSAHLAKALKVALGQLEVIHPRFDIYPTIAEVEWRIEDLIKHQTTIGTDIETTGGLTAGSAQIIVVGIADAVDHAFSVPFLCQGGRPYWPRSSESKHAWDLLRRLMASNPVVIQNAPYDMTHLRWFGCPVKHIQDDILLMHHAISPEQSHKLEDIASVYAATSNWKDKVAEDPRRLIHMPDDVVRTYNCTDAVVLLQMLDGLRQDMDEVGTTEVYKKFSLPMVNVVSTMSFNGISLSEPRRVEWQKQVEAGIKKFEKATRKIAQVPDSFNFSSPFNMRYLFYGVTPESLPAKRKLIASYDEPKTRKSKDTKAYRDLVSFVEPYDQTKPFRATKAQIRRSRDTGTIQTNEEALLGIEISASNILEQMSRVKRKYEGYDQKRADYQRILEFIEAYRLLSEYNTYAERYIKFTVGADGRIHPSFKIHGTATGRLSSSDPNMQNIPAELSDHTPGARRIFVPAEGMIFLEVDYSNIELRVLALASDDDVLMDMFNRGLNVHDENTKRAFPGLSPDHPMWKLARHAMKTFIFALIYEGSVETIFRRVALQVPKLGLTFRRTTEIYNEFLEGHPNYHRWRDDLREQIVTTRTVETAHGRKRFLLQRDDNAAIRAGINHPIQGTANEVAFESLVQLHKLIEEGKLKADILLAVHDSVLFELKPSDLRKSAKLIRGVMESPRKLWGKTYRFPIDMKISAESWGEMKEWKDDIKAVRRRRDPNTV